MGSALEIVARTAQGRRLGSWFFPIPEVWIQRVPERKWKFWVNYGKKNVFATHLFTRTIDGNQVSYDLRSYGRIFCNCVEKPEKFRASTGFEPVTSRFRCDALTNWGMKPLTLGAGHERLIVSLNGAHTWRSSSPPSRFVYVKEKEVS